MHIEEKISLAKYTTFNIGGTADFLVTVENEKELAEALEFARRKNLPVLTLGFGSNILVSDEGFAGLVILNRINGLDIGPNDEVRIQAGENWDEVVKTCVEKNLAGIECLSGVPGTAGGALVQNIGAYGQTLADVVEKVYAIDIDSGKKKEYSTRECGFMYRKSVFKQNPNFVVVGFTIKLHPGGQPNISYPHVKKHFELNQKPTLSEVRDFIIKIRASKGYLIMPGYESFQTAGSYFKNPIISREEFEKLKPMFGDPGLNRFWEVPDGIKLAAAFLMQEAGFDKGYREGRIGISPKHSLSIVNFGGAKASEVRAFADKIKKVVYEKFSVKLEEEVLLI